MNIWENLPKPFFALAPMEDVTNVVFRKTILQAGKIADKTGENISANRPDILFTEFTNATSFCSEKGEFSTRGRLTFDEKEQPIIAQIWGGNSEDVYQMTTELREKNFAGVDINMGCPDKSVVKNGGGSALIENPKLAIELIQSAKSGWINNNPNEKSAKSSTIPISVKTRLGARKAEEFRDWLPKILEQNIANLTIHLRSRKEMSKVSAHFELIPEILNMRKIISPKTKITINGDIFSKKIAAELYRKNPEIDGFMIGRGVFANPFVFTNIENPTRKQLFELLNFQLDQFDFWRIISDKLPSDDPRNLRKFDPLKRFFKIYIHDFPGAKELREKMMSAKSTNEVREILRIWNFKNEIV